MTQATLESRVFENAETLALNVAEWLCDLALASDRDFSVCLSGGSTPKRLHDRLAGLPTRAFSVEPRPLVLGRQRFVPHTHLDSNYRMTEAASSRACRSG